MAELQTIAKPRTFRSEKYLSFIRMKHCLVCGQQAEPHHEFLGQAAVGQKVSDSHAVPLCRADHEERHLDGVKFWDSHLIDVKMEIIKLLTEYLQGLE